MAAAGDASSAAAAAAAGGMDEAGDAPPSIEYEHEVFGLAFHPQAPVVAAGLISGTIHLHQYAFENNEQMAELDLHTEAVRALTFSDGGEYLFSASSDKSLLCIDSATGQLVHRHAQAHGHAINTVATIAGQNMVVTGDDEGYVKVWDLRQSKKAMQYRAHEDYITDTACREGRNMLLASSADGHMSAFDLRHQKEKISELQEDELLSMALMKDSEVIALGTMEGEILFFKYGEYDDYNDKLKGHAKSIDSMVALDSDLLVTGSSDGLLRVVYVQPHQILGVLGEHGEYPIERVRLSGDRSFVGSCSHDKTVRFWNVTDIYDKMRAEERAQNDVAASVNADARGPAGLVPVADDDFFNDL